VVTFVENSTVNQSVYQSSPFGRSAVEVSQFSETTTATCSLVSLRSIASELDSQVATPLHDQIFLLLKKALDDGHLEDVCDGRLPSLRNMSTILGVSRETVSKAVSKLTGYGYLSAQERKHIFVLPRRENAYLNEEMQNPCDESTKDVASQDLNSQCRNQQLDFRPPEDKAAPHGGYGKNYLTDKYLKTLRRQSSKRARFDLDPCGLVSFREVLCEQMKRDSELNCRAENLIVFSDFRSCADFIVRLTTRERSTCIMERPGCPQIRSILDLYELNTVQIPVDEEGMCVDIVRSLQPSKSVCFVSPTMQDPLGVRLSAQRLESLLSWAKESNSVIVEHSSSPGFHRLGAGPAIWQADSDQEFVYVWTITSALKPWTQTCCAVFSNGLIKEAKRLKSITGGEVGVTEQMALQDFILDGDLLRAERQRELINLEKRRRIGLAFSRIFNGEVRVWRGNCGPKLVLEVESTTNSSKLAETSRFCGLPIRLLDECGSNDQNTIDRRLVLDLDLINVDTISSRIENLESLLSTRKD